MLQITFFEKVCLGKIFTKWSIHVAGIGKVSIISILLGMEKQTE